MDMIVLLCLGLVSLSLLLSIVRLFAGPTAPDRVLSMDSIWINVVGVFVLLSMLFHTPVFFDAVLVVALLGFLGTMCLCFFLDRGDVFR